MTSKKDLILMHLLKYVGKDNGKDMPFETTQDGIAIALGMTRGHVSIVLGKLMNEGLVRAESRHAGTVRLRMCYRLTSVGIIETRKIVKGIDDPLRYEVKIGECPIGAVFRIEERTVGNVVRKIGYRTEYSESYLVRKILLENGMYQSAQLLKGVA